MLKSWSIIALSLTFLLLSNCERKPAAAEQETVKITVPDNLPFGFPEFYQKFHTDSLFQMEHIQWPLSGLPDRPVAEGEKFYFQPEDWSMQRPIDPTSGYTSEFMVIMESLIQEEIYNAADNTNLIRRFLYNQDGWNLIYYQGVRKKD